MHFCREYEPEQSWEFPSNKMIKLHNNDLTHELLGSCPIFTRWPLLNSSVEAVSSWESRFPGLRMIEDLFFAWHFLGDTELLFRQSRQGMAFYFSQARIKMI
jgi:hypothetical protein